MLTRFRIKTRLIVLMAVQALALIGVGVYAVSALREAGTTVERLNGSTIEQVALNQLSEVLRNDLYGTVSSLGLEQIEWNVAQANLKAARNLFISHWDEYQNDKTPQEIDELRETLAKHYSNVLMSFDDLILIVANQDRARLTTYTRTQLNRQIGPFLTELGDRIAEAQLQSGNLFEATARDNVWSVVWTVLATVLGLATAGAFGYYVYRSIRESIDAIAASVNRVMAGDAHARTGLIATDELGALGAAFDRLLDERVATLVRVEEENARLNESVITLLQAVSQLSQRDLTVRIPVTEDVTGPVADALNQLTGEMTRVLLGVRRIAEQVAKASTMVRMQSDVVISVASQEHQEVEQTAAALDQAARTLNHITELSADCNSAAEQASKTTHTALQTVTATVAGINAIRATIHETEKRIKRLGERSNDIGRAIGLIGSIAERTHILALNASMHAAAAGEAGRGFAVVADEVQRLAENARDATQQIASLVSNIQSETAETVKQMNQAIAQVIDGSRMAEQAGEHMLQTQASTDRLVAAVKQIASDTEDQVRLGSELQAHARSIQDSTRKTRTQMEEQTQYAKRLSQFSKGLLTAVQVFKLSELRKIADEAVPPAPDAGDETEFAPAQQKVG